MKSKERACKIERNIDMHIKVKYKTISNWVNKKYQENNNEFECK